MLEQQAAVDMLADAGPEARRQAVAADRPAAEALADLLGCLPLALHVIGRRLNRLTRVDGPAGAAALLRDELAEQITDVLLEPRNPLEAVLRLVYDTLAEDARRAFRRLAVFGPQPLTFDAEAMAAVLGSGEEGCERPEDRRGGGRPVGAGGDVGRGGRALRAAQGGGGLRRILFGRANRRGARGTPDSRLLLCRYHKKL